MVYHLSKVLGSEMKKPRFNQTLEEDETRETRKSKINYLLRTVYVLWKFDDTE